MPDHRLEREKKLIESKMLLDTFEIPKRPVTMSAHQFKKKHGSSIGYADYKRSVKVERAKWDKLYKKLQRDEKQKIKYLSQVSLSDEAMAEAKTRSKELGISIPDVIGMWLEKGRES